MSMTPEESLAQALSAPVTPEASAAAGEPVQQQQQQEAPAESKVNPSWEEAWTDVPDPIKAQQRAVFEKWDRNQRETEARFAPYKGFEQAGVAPEYIQQALALQEQLVDDPRGFWDQMGQAWGFSGAELQRAFEASQGDDELDPDDPRDARLIRLEQAEQDRQQQQYEQQQTWQQRREVEQAEHAVVADLASLKAKIGDYDEEAVIERALTNATLGRNPSVEVAYYELKKQEDVILARVQRTAPRVLGGGAPAVGQGRPEPTKMMTNDERLAAAMAMAKQLAEG